MDLSKVTRVSWSFLTVTILLLQTFNGCKVLAQQTHRVVIVGAGLSGYSAAAKLLENGVDDIVVLEAENRIGGRVYSVPLSGTNGTIDIGAQWLHGQENNLIYELIDNHFEFGDSSFENAEQYFHLSDGVEADQIPILALANLSEIIMSRVYTETPPYLGTFGSFFVSNYLAALRTAAYNTIPWNLALKVLNYYHTLTNNYFGTNSWFDISIEEYSQHGYTLGNQYVTWRDAGFATVFEYLSKRLPNPSEAIPVESKIELNKVVTTIHWEDNIATLACADGSKYSADYVIFTASLGVLKARHRTMFIPELPAATVNAIEHSEYGSLEKIFLEFEDDFWNDGTDEFAEFSILWTPEHIEYLVGSDAEWLLDIGYLRRIDAFPKLLGTFFIGARFSSLDFLTPEKIIADMTWMLQTMLGPNAPAPIRAIRSDWISQSNFLGSYSLFTMNSAHHGASPRSLAEPVLNADGRPRIFFAGEATSLLFSGYSNGAVETGFRAAAEVLTITV